MKFLKKLIVSESLKYLEKNLKIGFVDFSETSQVSKELEDDIINNRDLILLKRYTKEKKFDLIKNDRNWKDPKKRIWAKGERKIATNAYYSFTYAEEIIKDQIQEDPNRWVEGEKSIATDSELSMKYIKFVTNRLFPLAEKVFLSNYEINEYMDFIKKNWNTFSEKEKKDINPDILKLIKF